MSERLTRDREAIESRDNNGKDPLIKQRLLLQQSGLGPSLEPGKQADRQAPASAPV